MYLCLKCHKTVDSLPMGAVRCPSCGNKIFSKMRDPITKTIKAL